MGSIGFRFDPNRALSVSRWQGCFYGQLETSLLDVEFKNNWYLDRASFELEITSKRFFNDKIVLLLNLENSIFGAGSSGSYCKSSLKITYFCKSFNVEAEQRYNDSQKDSSTLVLLKKIF